MTAASGGPRMTEANGGPLLTAASGGPRMTEAGGEARLYRIVWLPGSDRLRGYCWCGSPREAEDPVELWQWLLDHPDQHGDGGTGPSRPGPSPDRLPGQASGRRLATTPS